MATTVQIGEKFAAYVFDIIKLKHHAARKEILIGSKRVDIYFEEMRLNKRTRVAVECKSYAATLTKDDIDRIHASYLDLHRANLIDEILIVTQGPISAAAQAKIQMCRELFHSTVLELEIEVIDFRPYVTRVVSDFAKATDAKYYVPLEWRSEDKANAGILDEFLLKRIRGDETFNIAILGSYGIGKSTLAARIAHELGKAWLADSKSRIPIIVKLSEISSEQSLEGLLGKIFTTTVAVEGYHFSKFEALNERGRFTIFLDGFDEMKHALSWEQFRYNFRQLNRLIGRRSQIILLGRPTAFNNDEEYNAILLGKEALRDRYVKVDDWPEYERAELLQFNKEQIGQFLENYIRTLPSRTKNRIEKTIRGELANSKLASIAMRPVQLRMLCEILPQWDRSLDNLTITVLYDEFIQRIILREMDKPTRLLFSVEERRSFAQKIAYYLWTTKNDMSLTSEDIPRVLLEPFKRPNVQESAIRRDLVAACFLNRKLGGALYFPHRSFQEFLVAQEVCDRFAQDDTTSLFLMQDYIRPEVADFLAGIIGKKELDAGLRKLTQPQLLRWATANALLGTPDHEEVILRRFKEDHNPWAFLLGIVVVIKGGTEFGRKLLATFTEVFPKVDRSETALVLLCQLLLLFATHEANEAMSVLVRSLAARARIRVRGQGIQRLRRAEPGLDRVLVAMELAIDGRKKKLGTDVTLKLHGISGAIGNVLRDRWCISEWSKGDRVRPEGRSFPTELTIKQADRELALELFR